MRKITAIITVLALTACCMTACGDTDGSRSESSSEPETKPGLTSETPVSEPAHYIALERYLAAMSEEDTDVFLRFSFPDTMYAQYQQDGTLDTIAGQSLYYIQDAKDSYKETCGDNIVFSLDEVLYEKDLTREQLACADNYFSFEGLAGDDIYVSKGISMDYRLKVTGDSGEDYLETQVCMLLIEGDGWKVYSDTPESLVELYSEISQPETTTQEVTTAPVTTAASETTSPTSLPGTSDTSDYYIPSMPSICFISMIMDLRPISYGGETSYHGSSAVFPTDYWDSISESGHYFDVNKEIEPYLSSIYNEIVAECGESPSILSDKAENTVLLTDEQLRMAESYYQTLIDRYSLTPVTIKFIGGFSADITMKCTSGDNTIYKTVNMISLTTDKDQDCCLPFSCDELAALTS